MAAGARESLHGSLVVRTLVDGQVLLPPVLSGGYICVAERTPVGGSFGLGRNAGHVLRVTLVVVLMDRLLAPGALFKEFLVLALFEQVVAEVGHVDDLGAFFAGCQHGALLPEVDIELLGIDEFLVEFATKLASLGLRVVLGLGLRLRAGIRGLHVLFGGGLLLLLLPDGHFGLALALVLDVRLNHSLLVLVVLRLLRSGLPGGAALLLLLQEVFIV